jgi:hypothetical protein
VVFSPLSAREGVGQVQDAMRKDSVRAAREAAREEVVFNPLRAREGVREAQEAMLKDGMLAAQECYIIGCTLVLI